VPLRFRQQTIHSYPNIKFCLAESRYSSYAQSLPSAHSDPSGDSNTDQDSRSVNGSALHGRLPLNACGSSHADWVSYPPLSNRRKLYSIAHTMYGPNPFASRHAPSSLPIYLPNILPHYQKS